jgi:hypothetical protein
MLLCITLCFCLGKCPAQIPSEDRPVPWLELGGNQFSGWEGLQPDNEGAADWDLSHPATFRYPQGNAGWYRRGFRDMNDGTRDWRSFYGLQFDVLVPPKRTLNLQVNIATPPPATRAEYLSHSSAITTVHGEGWQHIVLPWSVFDFEKGRAGLLQFLSQVQLSGKYTDDFDGKVKLRNVRVIRGPGIFAAADIRGKAIASGETAHYSVMVGNCSDSIQEITLTFEKYGWEAMTASVDPTHLTLAPGKMAMVDVSVRAPTTGIPVGGHERQRLLVTAGSYSPATLELITACQVPHPFIQLTASGWQEVRDKVKKYDWAARDADRYIRSADAWEVPMAAVAPDNFSTEGHVYSFRDEAFRDLSNAAVAWQLTRNPKYAEKVALFLRRLADEKNGYPATFAGTHMGEPQEGGNFQGVAIAYDAILDAGVLSDADKSSIEHMFRLYLETIESPLGRGNVGNWNVAAATGGLFISLAMGDLAQAERYLYGPSGFTDFLTKGVMDDGWWWECSTSYNFWVASELTECALACKPWGIDLLNREFPAAWSPRTIITPWGVTPQYGMSLEKWGAVRRNTRSIKMLWDAVPGVADYRGIAFGINDGREERVSGSRLELGYYAFRDPAYVPLIKLSNQRDLIYGVPELPETTAKPYLQSSLAENLGSALLRSQTPNREPGDQIEAVFKIGTQGGYHGHFDRCSLNTIMRYGQSFWSPESIWWGYPNFMYKFYVQTSVAHNMVVVDQKQQEAVPASQLLFYSGKMMQVSAQEVTARWYDPPYGGMQYDAAASGGAVKDFPAGMRRNRQSVPLVTDRVQGEIGPPSEPVLQRRVGVVTDDYIVIADYLKSEQPHTFDNLFQMKAFQGLDAIDKKLLRHDPQFNSDPHSAAQFVTDCNWYMATAPTLAKFQIDSASGARNSVNAPGSLKLNMFSLWPPRQELMLAQPPENLDTQKWVKYEVFADGKSITSGESGMWVLGAVHWDVPIDGAKELVIKISADGSNQRTLFLADERVVTSRSNGRLPPDSVTTENGQLLSTMGNDYYGGPIKIEGTPFEDALPVEPNDRQTPVVIHIKLAGADHARFQAILGADYPLGDESKRRRVFASRIQGNEARFLTIIEPFENVPMVKSASANAADQVRVVLEDGRVQEMRFKNLDQSEGRIAVELSESKNGKVLRSESSQRG